MKRLLSLFLALCTALSSMALCPIPVYSADTKSSTAEVDAQTQFLENEPQDSSVENIFTETETIIPFEETLDDCKILQHVDADAFAQADHAFRMPELETMDTYVFQNNDGTRSVYYMNEAVKYTDSLGNIREKDLTLRSEKSGYRMAENEFDLFLPASIADGVTLTYEGYEVKLAPTGGKASALLQNNAVVYDEYFGTGTSLRYTPMLSGVKEEIVLASYIPDMTYTFVLVTDGLFLTASDGRYALAEDADGKNTVLYLSEIVIYDAIGKPSYGTLAVETIKEGTAYALTVTVDEAFLTDPTTVYPVTIDPTITVKDTASSAGNLTGYVEDTTIFSGAPNTNAGDWLYLTAGYTDDTYKVGRTLVRLPGLYNSSTFASLTANDITSVTFYCYDSTGNASQQVYLFPCTSSWTESTVTWNSFNNAFNGANMIPASMVPNAYTSYTITSIVKGWKNGTYPATAGFMLANFNESDVSKKKGPFSSEHSNQGCRPYVVMTYAEPVEEEEETPTISFPDLSAHTMLVGGTYPQQVAVTPADAQLIWSSSNTYVATVDTTGFLRAKKAGITTITARISGTTYSVSRTVYVQLSDGIYQFNDISYGRPIGFASLNAYQNNTALLIRTTATSADRDVIFKLKYLGNGLYSIRSMIDNSMGWKRDGSSLVCSSIGTSAATVPNAAKWVINTDAQGYYIYGYNGTSTTATTYTVTCPAYTNNGMRISSYPSDTTIQHFTISRLTVSYNDVTIFKNTDGVAVGGEYTLSAGVYSTSSSVLGQNGYTWDVTNGTGTATISSSGVLTGLSPGTVTVHVKYKFTAWTDECTMYIVPFEDGVYYLRNRETLYYADIEDQIMANGTTIHQWEFHSGATQKWELKYDSEGYYTIKSTHSNTPFYLGANNETPSLDSTVVLRLGTIEITDAMRWKFAPATSNAYKIVSKLDQTDNHVLVTTSSTKTNGADLAYGYYVVNTSYRDEWFVCSPRSFVKHETQETDVWCWVASARMACSVFLESHVSQANAAVYVDLKKKMEAMPDAPTAEQIANATVMGTIDDIGVAMEYILGGYFSYAAEYKRYSETTLRSLLDDSNPVVIISGYYANGSRQSGHATIIVDYNWDISVGKYLFTVYDPAINTTEPIKHLSYEAICGVSDAQAIGYVWESSACFKIGNYEDTIAWSGIN